MQNNMIQKIKNLIAENTDPKQAVVMSAYMQNKFVFAGAAVMKDPGLKEVMGQ